MRVKNSFTTVHAIPSASVIAAGQLLGRWRWAARGAADGHGECPLARVAAGGERQRTAGRRQVVVEGRAHPARQTGGPEGHLAGKAGVIVLVLVLLEPGFMNQGAGRLKFAVPAGFTVSETLVECTVVRLVPANR